MSTTNQKPQKKSLKEVMEISDDVLDQARTLAYELYQAEKFDDLEVALKGILAADNRDAWALSLYASMLRKQNKFKEAMVLLETAHAMDPANENISKMRDEMVAFAQAMVQAKSNAAPAGSAP